MLSLLYKQAMQLNRKRKSPRKRVANGKTFRTSNDKEAAKSLVMLAESNRKEYCVDEMDVAETLVNLIPLPSSCGVSESETSSAYINMTSASGEQTQVYNY